jgi:Carboxypeptidase regulatory-like domain
LAKLAVTAVLIGTSVEELMLKLRILAFAALVVLASISVFAQTGAIQGTVSDKSGAVVQGADVVAKNLATGVSSAAKTGSTGLYTFTNLAVGHYGISITKAGFKTYRLDDVELTVAQTLGIDAALEPGAVTEEVIVRASEVPPVDLETSQVSNLVDSREILDLPLITRDPYSLVLLSPGTSQTNAMGGFTVNGARERNNNFLLDGVDNNDTSVPGIPGGVLSANPDSTEEFRVITNNFNAEYGRNTGAIVDVVTKSGTNSFHGGVYEFGRWNAFGGARDWFNPADQGKMNPYVRNQFGYTIGGPIIKNKTFFFFNQEFQRFRTTLTDVATVPTAAFKTGQFTYNGTPLDITQTGANNATPTILEQFGVPVVLPAAPDDATMQKVFALYPNPTLDDGNGYTGTLLFPSSSQQNSYQAVAKIDHHFTDRQSLSIRYGYDHFFDPNPGHAEALPGNVGGYQEKAINQGLSANLTSTLSNNLINSFSFGWNHIYATFNCTGTSTLDSVIPQVDQFGNGWDFNMDPFTSFGCLALVSNGQWRKTGTTSYTDSLSWVHGGHTFKFGGDFRNISEQGPDGFFSRRQVGLATSLNFGLELVQGAPGNFSFALNDAAAAYYGLVWQDFNAEFFDKTALRQPTDNKHFRQHEYDWFGQDTWKVRSNITLTLGLRYQLDGVPFEEGANFSNLLVDPASAPPLTMSIVGPGTGKSIYSQDYSNIEPRIGFSWDPWKDGKTAVRGAFGIFHDRVFGNLFGNARGNPPFEQDYITNPLDTINGFYGGGINGGFPLPAVPETVPSAIIPDGAHLAPVIFDPHFKNSASNNWNFGIQREIPGNNTIDLSYVASKGTHIYREMDGNPPDPTLTAQLVTFCSDPTNAFGCTPNTVTKINLYEGADFGVLPFNAVKYNALVQPFFIRSVANSNYNSLQLKLTHRLSHGLQVQGSFTWAHALDDSGDPLVPAAGNRGFPRNSRNLAGEYGNSDNDVRHILVVNYIWEAPIGKGKAYLNHGFAGKLFEGIQFSGITTVQTGHPFDVYSSTDSERTGLSNRGSLIGNPFAAATTNVNPGIKTFFSNYDPNNYPGFGAFEEPAYGGPGNIGRNHFTGPGFVNFDMVFSKRIRFTERVDMQLRIEGYNIFNHPAFSNPGNLLGGAFFGQITSTVSRPDATTSARQMQAGLKLNF